MVESAWTYRFDKAQAVVYGKCVVADYNSVHKDKCVKEFMKLKDCYLVWTLTPFFRPSMSTNTISLIRPGRCKGGKVTDIG